MKKSSALAVRSDSRVIDVDFNGYAIKRDGDYLNATDMWKAGGKDPSKEPGRWRKTDAAQEYLAALDSDGSQNPIAIRTTKGGPGGGGGTWLHRLAAVEYARYLNPAFAVFVNRLFIDVTEDGGRELARSGSVDVMLVQTLARTAETLDRIERRMEASETAMVPLREVPKRLDAVERSVDDMRTQLAVAFAHKRKTPSKVTREHHIDACAAMGGLCPFCDVPLFDSEGKFTGNIHHHDKASDARVEATMPCCGPCNQRFNIDPTPRYVVDSYHARRLRMAGPLFRRRSA